MQYMTDKALQYIKDYKGIKTAKEISKELNLSYYLVRDYFKKIYKDPNLVLKTDRDKKNVWLQEYLTNNIDIKLWNEMVHETKVPMTTLIYYANKFGLNKSAHLNENYFHNINSERPAYWLGYIMADGFVWERLKKLVIDISAKDYNLLCAFKEDLQCTNKIRVFNQVDKRRNKVYKKALFSVTSEKLYNDLLSYGCIPKKSLILEFPSMLPKHCIRHWIRGYIDGDGYLGISYRKNRLPELKFSIVGTENTLLGIKKEMNLNCNVLKKGSH